MAVLGGRPGGIREGDNSTLRGHYAVELTDVITDVQLRVFAGSSESGYRGCACLRLMDVTGVVTFQLVLVKSRVAPLKIQT